MARSWWVVALAIAGMGMVASVCAEQAHADTKAWEPAAKAAGDAFVKAGHADGLSIAVVRGGKASFLDAGTKERGKAVPPTADTVYEIGSITKTFGSLLLAQAIVANKAQLGDDMRRYLPEGDYPGLAYEGRPVTLRELAATTSGLPDNLPDALVQDMKQAKPADVPFLIVKRLNGYTAAQFLADLRQASLQREPGKTPAHSNVAAQVVGLIDARLFGKPFETVLAERIERPLGMASGTDKNRADRMAIGYTGDGRAAPVWDAPVTRAAGGLRYSTRDMARYLERQLDESDPAVKLTHQPQWGDAGERAIGFNWVIETTIDGQVRLSHSGGTFGFASYMELYPSDGYGVVLLANRSATTTQGELQAVAERIHDAVFGASPAQTALDRAFAAQGFGDVAGTIAGVRRAHPRLHLTEGYVNAWGYRLLQEKRTREAVNVFAYNTTQHAASANVYDSLAEAYEALGDHGQAITNYRLSLERNPGNEHAKGRLAVLEKPSSR